MNILISYDLAIATLLFLLGTCLASFFGAQIYRIEKGMKLWGGDASHSVCESCKKKLTAVELIPVLGWVIKGGKCDKCGYSVPWFYPVTELVFGAALLFLFLISAHWSLYILVTMLFFLSLYDFQYKGFPQVIMHSFLIVGFLIFIFQMFFSPDRFSIYSVVLAMAILVIIWVMNQFRMLFGFGDLLVFLLLSFFLDVFQLIDTIAYSILVAGVTAILALALKRVSKKDSVPFVPFIFIGLFVMLYLGGYAKQYYDYIVYLW